MNFCSQSAKEQQPKVRWYCRSYPDWQFNQHEFKLMFILPCLIGSGTTNRDWRSVRMPSDLFHWGSPLSVYFTTFLKGIFWQFSVWFQVPVKKPLCPRHPAGHAAENVTCEHLFFFLLPSLLPLLLNTTCWFAAAGFSHLLLSCSVPVWGRTYRALAVRAYGGESA